ncbi:MAG: hypothetical protein A3J27_00475 [Candidatus Tectomicrobia bacterium RIFCSPLOWO2_12_FULL_69_37]|nr:MAG: hypothetical protein A3J27_00475 [Candidatus Tectomicrobia bacterium RIFCSPLOWO2_12_FULL_69_37]
MSQAAGQDRLPPGSWAGLLLLGGIFLLGLLPPPAGLPAPAHRTLAVAAGAIVLWTSEILPAGVTGVLVVLLLYLTGAAPTLPAALTGFASPVPYFLIGVLTLAMAVEKVGLAERLAWFFLRSARGRCRPLFWQMILSFPLLTLLLPSATTRSAILAGVYDRAFSLGGVARGAPVARAVMMGLGSVNRLASTTMLTGGMTPIVAAALIGGIGWGRWFVLLAAPYAVTLLIGSAFLHLGYLRGAAERFAPGEEERLPLRPAERRTVLVVLGASALWLTDGVHHLDPAVPAILAWALLLAPRLGVLDWREFESRLGWANFFILAASLSLGHAIVRTGAARWLAAALLRAAPTQEPYALLAFLLAASIPVRMLIPNITGFLAVTIPIAMELGRQAGLNPQACGLAVMIMGDTVLFYPAQSASALVVYERGHITAGEVFRFGLLMTAAAYAVTMTFSLLWWEAVGFAWRG